MAQAYVQVHPSYQAALAQNGLVRFEDFFGLQSLIVGGHPGRNVSHVNLGAGPHRVRGFLKREYGIHWRERLRNAWDGFGFVSRSRREATLLQDLPDDCGPQWIAFGEDGRGRAFVLLAEESGSLELRDFCRRVRMPCLNAARDRRHLAAALGEMLAQIHRAGLEHGGLLAKHVLINPSTGRLTVIDWQRARRQGPALDWPARLRDLAALDATLAADLASPRERLVFLRHYLYASEMALPATRWILRRLGDLAVALLRKRHIREVRLSQPAPGQGVLWLDGEALCVTARFHAELRGNIPRWLRGPNSTTEGLTKVVVPLAHGRRGLLVWRRRRQPLRWLWSLLWGKPLVTPEVREAGLLFRHQRHGLPAPRLLAFGQRSVFPGRTESFLLTELTPSDGRKAG